MKTLGDRLRNARERKNLTQIDVSKQTGINNKTISNYENNVSSPDPLTLKLFAEVYETSTDYLIGCSEKSGKREDELTPDTLCIDVFGLPDEAVRQIEDYAEFIRLKYKQTKTSKRQK
ncbi:MAG: helix-turn-helix domain-containing protein [Clostridia bacterium]|nr:helix-turn-helix domain-containing protein [Clostridia bacterium]